MGTFYALLAGVIYLIIYEYIHNLVYYFFNKNFYKLDYLGLLTNDSNLGSNGSNVRYCSWIIKFV